MSLKEQRCGCYGLYSVTSAGPPRIHVVPETDSLQHAGACAALRLLDPYSHPTIATAFDVSFGLDPVQAGIDILVLQRSGPIGMGEQDLERIVGSLRARGTRLLYDLDDNLLDPHPDAATEIDVSAMRRRIRFLLRNADLVTVSTAPLRDRVLCFNRHVVVLPNALDERRFSPVPSFPAEERTAKLGCRGLKVGYYGTFTHTRDLMSVAAPLRAAFAGVCSDVRFILFGISLDPRVPLLFDGVATVETVPVKAGDYGSFVRTMRRQSWDIGLAPLTSGPFESAKSDIKFLEYAAFGIAGLYSAHPAYQSVVHGVTGMIGPAGKWPDLVRSMLGDATLRVRIVTASQQYVFSERTLATANHERVALLRRLLRGLDDAER